MVKVKDAEQKDLPEIVRIYNESIPAGLATADTTPISIESRQNWLNEHSPGVRPLWVVPGGTGVLAWLSFRSFYGRPAYTSTCEISVYVQNASQGLGLGRALLGHAIEQAPEIGVDRLVGFIFGHNEPSLRLFKKFGFLEWGHLPGIAKMPGGRRDLKILGLTLD